MGASNSKIEEDKALQLCRERKKFVRQALDGRCSLAAAHVTYIQSLKNTGTALRKFVEPEASIESSLYTSTSATPEPLALTEKSLSQFSYSSPSLSQRVEAAETLSPTPSPPLSGRFRVNYMKAGGGSSRTVEERAFPVTRTLKSSSSTLQNLTPRSGERPETSPFQDPPLPPEVPWDYFGLPHSIDNQFSFHDGRGLNHDGLDSHDDITHPREEEGMSELEDEEQKSSYSGRMESEESEDEFDEPSTENLVRSFENRNRVLDSHSTNTSPIPEAKILNGDKSKSPDLTPLRTTASVAPLPIYDKKLAEIDAGTENKLAPKDFLSIIKEVELLFLKASESGKEVPRMLEANKFHFRPIFPGKEGHSRTSMFLKACFSCGEDPMQVPEEPAVTTVKYLTWHRTTSHSSSSRNLLGSASKDHIEDESNNLFSNSCMNSGSHASTLDRLYAWERKLYDEVKASGMIRGEYDNKCKLLRQLESNGEHSFRIDKTRAVVKDLHSRIRVAIHRIDSISKRIEELRDKELQPQLEELIEGLSRMWEMMSDYHKRQYNIIRIACNNGSVKWSLHSESHQHATSYLEYELNSLSSSFTKWINAQKAYMRAIDGWLHKCVFIQQKTSRRKKRLPDPSLRDLGPPIYLTCGLWLEKLEGLPTKDVSDSIKALAAETTSFLPRQEKNQGKSSNRSFMSALKAVGNDEATGNALREEPPQDLDSGFDRFQSSLVGVLDQFNCFAESSVNMYIELQEAIRQAKNGNEQDTRMSYS
ncbi:protein ROLLING AND ERECT LEAF 2-like [Macadamia integrifolia]|uniref:protein ROLLING AND ERECT LEAF 2-like n=1 Tax=Macadamia integrifolia TaxID=60698 RepID=UPI001C4E7BF6|nr:protein ROLLING AND ERECT LEAF 2-like [Macadamia integrifolia]XP_042514898.1 protein ROLLING AND ERECT LEAF 2-like [Macadamia integrifolia]XP_042514899.1 protein ROLLING AND ERECT LEAF 2-like [Macadamia integrifolia]XP_042514900.1 protein ROLLING AND ERECT LEAF 2-like [Macadamia integrifolia]XP_042514901.1 protein ROLLING AND ERECT LEAF 2-like [Macadamia integrifolia]